MPTAADAPPPAPGSDALRRELDALAPRLAVRRSVDEVRRGLYRIFSGLLAVGLAVKLGWDRYGALPPGAVRKVHAGPPAFLWAATALAVLLLALAVRAFLRARRLGREEDALFARLRTLRRELGIDP